jgi:hypothetical protein
LANSWRSASMGPTLPVSLSVPTAEWPKPLPEKIPSQAIGR